MNKDIGRIFDIQSYSVHDGPGCRTTVFLEGCFLQCEWCANPESWSLKQKIMFAKTKCKHKSGCNRCLKICTQYGVYIDDENNIALDWEKCATCNSLACAEVCYHEALKKCGKEYSTTDLMKIFNRDRDFWSKEGGVTFSGGEPFCQKDFLLYTAKKCKEAYIHTAIETTAFTNTVDFLEVMQYVDFAFIDVKHMDREKHKEKTGVYNDQILQNIQALKQSGWKGRMVLRMPVIKGFNDSEENIIKTASFMEKLSLVEINILPFHRMGDSKWSQLGRNYQYKNVEATSMEELEKIQTIFLDRQIACYIGSDTAF